MTNRLLNFARVLALWAVLLVAAARAGAQPGGGMQGPQFSGAMEKLFGEHKAFSANLEMQIEGTPAGAMTMGGSIAYLEGKSRFDMDMSQMKAASLPAQALAQMKQMGMDKIAMISAPDAKVMRMLYPSMKAYVEMPIADEGATTPATDFKMESTELGKETVDGHPTTKNKVVVTGKDGKPHESTVWNATDLDKFPVKIATTENGVQMTMLFKDVKFEKPDSAKFDAPSDYKKYDSMMNLMMSRMKGGPGAQ